MTAEDNASDPSVPPGARPARPRQLGRGLSALFGEEKTDYAGLDAVRQTKSVPVEFLHPNRFQPRRHFDEIELADLAASMASHGVLQPILVRRHPDRTNEYEIIAGERRWRAAQRAQLHEVPVVIREVSDAAALELAIIENVQRQNLNAMEEAEGYHRLMSEFAHTQEAVAKIVGKSRSHVANLLRLLTLPEEVKEMVREGMLSAGHARALVGTPDPLALAREIAERGLSVREAEVAARDPAKPPPVRRGEPEKDADTRALEHHLSDLLGLKVTLVGHGETGRLTIHYRSLDQLDSVIRRFGGG